MCMKLRLTVLVAVLRLDNEKVVCYGPGGQVLLKSRLKNMLSYLIQSYRFRVLPLLFKKVSNRLYDGPGHRSTLISFLDLYF